MTRGEANRILDAVRGGADHSQALITAALCETGDLCAFDVFSSFVEEWDALRMPDPATEEIAV